MPEDEPTLCFVSLYTTISQRKGEGEREKERERKRKGKVEGWNPWLRLSLSCLQLDPSSPLQATMKENSVFPSAYPPSRVQ